MARGRAAVGRLGGGATDDGWAHGPWLSVLGHVGMLLGIAFFTWVFLADRR